MKILIFSFMILLMIGARGGALAQDKGVDQQTDRIRETGNDRAPANNGNKQNVGAGRGFDFGKGRTPNLPPIPNPYRFSARRDVALRAIQELMRERSLVIDSSVSKLDEGVLISQPYRFVKGSVVAQTELNRYASLTEDSTRGWSQGRYTIIVEAQPVDGTNTNVAVNARVEGRSDGASGAEWVSLPSSGLAEQEFLGALIEKITGGPPPNRPQ